MRGNKVLLVDDEPDILAVGELALGAVGGFDVVTARSGADAIRVALAEAPDLILLDVMMPGMDGPTAFARLRERPETRATPVIFMTAKVQKAEVDRYLDMGACGVIAKPFDPMGLADEVRRLVSG